MATVKEVIALLSPFAGDLEVVYHDPEQGEVEVRAAEIEDGKVTLKNATSREEREAWQRYHREQHERRVREDAENTAEALANSDF